MRIERKIQFGNAAHLVLIVLIGLFAVRSFDSVRTKLRFVEIADDLNVALLEARLNEKNWFLYHDAAAIEEIHARIERASTTIAAVEGDISRAVGPVNLQVLKRRLADYAGVVALVRAGGARDRETEELLRVRGRELRGFSTQIVALERARVSAIIESSKRVLGYSILGVLLLAVLVGHFVSINIVRPIRAVAGLAQSIAAGSFTKIEPPAVPRDETGRVIEALNAMSSELQDREELLIQSKKLASIGILVAGVAHELNNPLNNISMIAQTYLELGARLGEEKRRELVTRIEGETGRIKEIVRNLLDFAKPRAPKLARADAGELVRQALRLVQNQLDVSNVETRLDLAPALPAVEVDTAQMQQVIVNIIVNAIQAMPEGGTLAIATRRGERPGFVELAFRDSGRGIPAEYLPHIFDPFFSTKAEGGTGLGLSVSYGIVRSHGGDILVESRLIGGTEFVIQLPAAAGERREA